MNRFLATSLVALAASTWAQDPFSSHQGGYVMWPYSYATGTQTNNGDAPAAMATHVVTVLGVPSIRLQFGNVILGTEDYIEVISAFDGHSQRLYPHELEKWSNTSAYFNGEVVQVWLWVMPGSTARFSIRDLIVGVGTPPSGSDTICGATDDRILSTDWRAMRAVSNPSGTGGGCTIWAANSGNCVLSAAHCTGTFGVAEAEVPLSTSGGGAQHPAPNRQWPINPISDSNPNSLGNDWAISQLSPNAQGELPSQLYGWFDLRFQAPVANEIIRITGYGSTGSGVSPTWNVVNKTHTGPYAATNGTVLTYATDTTGGNSGSPVIHEASGEAVGIHTNGGCTSTGGANSGTGILNTGFQAAWAQTCGTPTAPVASFSSTNPAILQGNSVTFVDTSSGIPSSWSWDLDGDGLVDSTSPSPTFTYANTGAFDVTLTVTNGLGSDTVTMVNYVNVSTLTPVSVPYAQDFNGGLPGQGSSGWSFTSDNSFGRIQATMNGTVSPASGGLALAMDSNTDGNVATNDATLVLSGASVSQAGAILTYYFKETGDEDDAVDGFWLSDGTNEVLVQPHTGTLTNWTQFTIDLVSAANQGGLTLSGNLRLIWRQRDNFAIPTDGHFVDDISVVPNNAFSINISSSNQDFFCQLSNVPSGTAQGYTFFSLNTTGPVGSGNFFGLRADGLTLTIMGTPASPGGLFHWTLPVGPTVYPNGAFTVPPGTLAAFAGQSGDGQAVALGAGFQLLGVTNVMRINL